MKGARKQLNPKTVIAIVAIVVIIVGGLFWKAAKGKPTRQAGAGRFGDAAAQQQSAGGQAAPGRQGR